MTGFRKNSISLGARANASNIFKAVVGVAAIFSLWGCDLSGNLIRGHEKMCKANGKIVVHDRERWKKYVIGAEKAFQERRRDFGEKTERAILEAVPGFDLRFGPKLDINRSYPKNGVLRSDAVIVSEGIVVARFIDFIAQNDSFSGPGRLICTGLYPNIYDLESVTMSDSPNLGITVTGN